jgi:hypothetical protein
MVKKEDVKVIMNILKNWKIPTTQIIQLILKELSMIVNAD